MEATDAHRDPPCRPTDIGSTEKQADGRLTLDGLLLHKVGTLLCESSSEFIPDKKLIA